MTDSEDLVEQLIAAQSAVLDKHRKGKADKALEDRLAALEQQVRQRGGDPDEVTDETIERWLERTGASLAGEADEAGFGQPGGSDDDEGGDDGAGDDAGDGDDDEPTRPRQRVTRRDVPRIHQGADEPDHVEYVDEEGKVAVRPGRKKNQPYGWDVDDLPDEPDGGDGGES